MAGYIFALTTQSDEVKYIFYEIAIALIKAREYHLILVRHRVDDDGSVKTMKIFDPYDQYGHAQ